MKHKPPTQVVFVTQPLADEDFKKNPAIKSTRRTLIVLLSIQLFSTLIYFIKTMIDVVNYHSSSNGTDTTMVSKLFEIALIRAGLSTVCDIIFLIAAYKYLRIAILVCACWSIVNLIGFIVIITIAFVGLVAVSPTINDNGVVFGFLILLILVGSIVAILPIMIIMFSFKLAKLMKKSTTHLIV